MGLVQNVMKRFGQERGIIQKLADSYHVDHRRGLTEVSWVDHVEVGDVVALDVVDKAVVDGVLVRRSCTLQPKKIGLRWILHRGLVVGQT